MPLINTLFDFEDLSLLNEWIQLIVGKTAGLELSGMDNAAGGLEKVSQRGLIHRIGNEKGVNQDQLPDCLYQWE